MRLTIDTRDRRAIYQQIADGIKSLIAGGELAEGAPLPPVRQLAADLGVNLNTIAAAYRDLQAEGLISIRHGSGAVVASRRSVEVNDDELRRTLRTALTQLVLAGLSRGRILGLVTDELQALMRGSK
jgi:GntR family transcriptional regulator